MKNYYTFYLLFVFPYFLSAQEKIYESNSSIKVEVHYYLEEKITDPWWSEFSSAFRYKGEYLTGLAAFFHIEPGRLKSKGTSLIKNIKIEVRTIDNRDFPAAYKLMYDHFTKTRGITVTEVTDSAEVWVMTVIDTNRLNSFVCTEDETEIGGFSGFSKLVNAYRLEFTELEFLREGIQTIFKKITYFDFQTPNKYSFEIPNEVMKSNSFEVLHDYLKHILGIKLHKEMRLEKFKLIDFHK